MSPEEFEQKVRELLRIKGWLVIPEISVSHKKVDALVRKTDEFGRIQVAGVECKLYQRKLTRESVSNIYADYLQLFDNKEIDLILLVTLNGITASANTYIENSRNIRHLTYLELLNSILDFSSYLNTVCREFENSIESYCYVPQNSSMGTENIEVSLLKWISEQDSKPIAILGGYGIGKSTLARRMAFLLANSYRQNLASRIPIRVIASNKKVE